MENIKKSEAEDYMLLMLYGVITTAKAQFSILLALPAS